MLQPGALPSEGIWEGVSGAYAPRFWEPVNSFWLANEFTEYHP
jgi:hypothetical protein